MTTMNAMAAAAAPRVASRTRAPVATSSASPLRVSIKKTLTSPIRRARFPAPPPAAMDDDDDGFMPNSLGTVGAAIELRSRLQELELELVSKRGGPGGDGWEKIAGAWVRCPPGRAWGVVHFVGGAVLGSYPHIAYDAFLRRLGDDAGVVIVATPYELGVDHGAISGECQKSLNDAWAVAAAREGYDVSSMPVFAAGHSLGCKLQLIAACGSGPRGSADGGSEGATGGTMAGTQGARAGHLFVSFNNATAADSVRLLEKFARELLKKRAEGAMGGKADQGTKDAFDGFMRNIPNLTALAEKAAAAAGLDFTPSPEETLDDAKRRFVSPRVKLVTFEDDDLDQNDELEVNLRKRFEFLVAGDAPVARATLKGNHLTPVFFKFDGAKLSPAFSKLGGLSVGDEEAVTRLAEEGVKFLRGK